jgi:acetylornithine deacetylase
VSTGTAARAAGIVERLAEFVAIRSVSGEEGRLADRIAEICEDAGVRATRSGRNVVARRGEGGPCLLLNSHLDTVPAVEGWSADPWTPRRDGDRLIGLGANDAKASVASQLQAFLSAPLPATGSLLFAATCDEETGGEGMEALAGELVFDAAIVGEPNDFAVAVSQKGLVKLKLMARGKAGHAARPHLADNAILHAAEDALAIEALAFSAEDTHLGRPTAAVTMIRGGVRSNIVPDRCELTVDARTVAGFDNDAMIAAIRGAVASDVEVLSARFQPVAGDPESRIARAALSAAPGRRATGFASVSDLAHLKGKPAIVFGPGTPEESHRADESISVASLLAAPDVYRRTIAAYFS